MGQNNTSPAAAEAVATREDLARYVEALHAELISGAVWENDRLDRFLGALASWIKSSPGYYTNTGRPAPDDASWSFFANALGAATIYE
ncbi:hypothetical protein SAMN05216275_15058 [Streptosporangium canum]|uniref:DUF7660 domain-containing protein n=1 Tax=Streptosporangium canum TaxID=324952 RepID=A0A1I4EJG1_9ACTN|nr:hypothetical protein [Streptosporangium canum]SFL05898.1 hypothetical protein SAMN05216275_15058 [Streptosporangium canum]